MGSWSVLKWNWSVYVVGCLYGIIKMGSWSVLKWNWYVDVVGCLYRIGDMESAGKKGHPHCYTYLLYKIIVKYFYDC